MKAQLLSVTLFTAFSGVLSAADPQLLNLVMPDAKVVAGVNVEQAKGTQFGQYILNQIQAHDADLQKLVTATGFDPRRDVREVLVASNGGQQSHTGLVLARGTFDPARISAAALSAGQQVATEDYKGITILEDPKAQNGMAFLDNTTVVAGDLANVKAAIDRRGAAQPLPADLLVKINTWSTSQDAWGISAVPPTSFIPAQSTPTQQNPMLATTQSVQQAYGGVKFGANVVFSGEAVCDTAQNAQTLGDLVKFMLNLAQMQASNSPEVAALIQSATVTPNGTSLKISASLPQNLFVQMLQPMQKAGAAARTPRK